jgi:hypothetical protein
LSIFSDLLLDWGYRGLLLIHSNYFAMHGCGGGAGEEAVIDKADCYRISEKGFDWQES